MIENYVEMRTRAILFVVFGTRKRSGSPLSCLLIRVPSCGKEINL